MKNDAKTKFTGLFVDWISLYQAHKPHAPFNSGFITTTDSRGVTIFEHTRSARLQGSYSTSCGFKSDGSVVVCDGNFGRFNRSDNLFNFDPLPTLRRVNSCAQYAGLPPFRCDHLRENPVLESSSELVLGGHSVRSLKQSDSRLDVLRLSRVDLTQNFASGSPSAARAVIKAIQQKNISRIKKGVAGDSSVWWANTRYMLKVYVKHLEMESHGVNTGRAYEFARDNGIVRVELELKRRELSDLGWSIFDNFVEAWELGNVHKLFGDYAKVIDTVAVSNRSEFIDGLPLRLRSYAMLFLSGQDVRATCSRATFFRYRRALLDYGLDIADDAPASLNVKISSFELQPVNAPEWYWKEVVNG